MEAYKSPYFRKHYRFLNDFYSNDYDILEKSPSKHIKKATNIPKNSANSPFLPATKQIEGPLTQVLEEDFYISKRETRKRESLSLSKVSFLNRPSLIKTPVLKNSNSFDSRKLSSLNSGLFFKSQQNPETYKKLLDRVRYTPPSNKDFVNKQEVMKIVEGLIAKYSEKKQETQSFMPQILKKNSILELEKSLNELDLTFTKVVLKPKTPIKQQNNNKNNRFFHLPGRFLCNIRLKNGFLKKDTINSYKSLLYSKDFTIVEETSQNIVMKKPEFLYSSKAKSMTFNKNNSNIFKFPQENMQVKTRGTYISEFKDGSNDNSHSLYTKNSKNKFINMIKKMHGN